MDLAMEQNCLEYQYLRSHRTEEWGKWQSQSYWVSNGIRKHAIKEEKRIMLGRVVQ